MKTGMEVAKSILCDQFGFMEEEVVPTASLMDDIGMDSLDAIELVMSVEESLDIEIPDETWERMAVPSTTVANLAEFIDKNTPARHSLSGK